MATLNQIINSALPPVWGLYADQGSRLVCSSIDLQELMLGTGRADWLVWVGPPWAPDQVVFTSSHWEEGAYVQYSIKVCSNASESLQVEEHGSHTQETP